VQIIARDSIDKAALRDTMENASLMHRKREGHILESRFELHDDR